jgi:HNH endonuclease
MTVEVDACDLGLLSKYKGRHYHVEGRPSGTSDKLILMHRLIMSPGPREVVDHINHNGLDNRRENLRVCSRTENNWNARKRKNSKSRFKGVRKAGNGWVASINVNKVFMHIGFFKTEIDAAEAYNNQAIKFYGRFAVLNNTKDIECHPIILS